MRLLMDNTIIYVVLTGIVGSIGYLLRFLHGKLSATLTEQEIRNLISDRDESINDKQEDLKEDIHRLEDKLDRLIESLIK